MFQFALSAYSKGLTTKARNTRKDIKYMWDPSGLSSLSSSMESLKVIRPRSSLELASASITKSSEKFMKIYLVIESVCIVLVSKALYTIAQLPDKSWRASAIE